MVAGAVPDSAQRFPQLFESPLLTAALDDLHGVNRAGAEGTEERRWEWLGESRQGHASLGSTHIRYPLPIRQPWSFPANAAAKLWRPPVLGWCSATVLPLRFASADDAP